MRRLRISGTVTTFDKGSSVDIISQIEDSNLGLQSDISHVVTEWNAEIYPILSTLPQGRSETRWSLDDSINPRVNGFDGTQVFVDNSATSETDGGRYYRVDSSRPRTIKESLNNLYTYVSNTVDSLRGEVTVVSSGGVSTDVQGRIGAGIFDPTLSSSSTSLHGVSSSNQLRVAQLAKDLYDDAYDSWTVDGSSLLSNYSLRDMVDALLQLHEGSWNSDITLGHEAADFEDTYSQISCVYGYDSSATSEVVAGTFVFDPTAFDGALAGYSSSVSPFLKATLKTQFVCALGYIGAGAGVCDVRLYDMGTPGSLGAGDLISSIDNSLLGSNVVDKVSVDLAVGTPLSWSSNQILNSERVYEIRIILTGTPGAGDVGRIGWGGLVVSPA